MYALYATTHTLVDASITLRRSKYMKNETKAVDVSDTSIRVSHELADELHSRKDRGDSYEDVIWELIEAASDEGGDAR